ncbi:MAG: hypothetical protein JOY78_21210, partial [Pseudonocardia sp.]|nr:hypothetical protein [Pseudonocardia sp.]
MARTRMWVIWAVGLAAYSVMQRTSFGLAGLDAAARFDATPPGAVRLRGAPASGL